MNTNINDAEKELYYTINGDDATNFSAMLIRLIMKSDTLNRFKLSIMYPDYVTAVNMYQYHEGYWEDLCDRMKKES